MPFSAAQMPPFATSVHVCKYANWREEGGSIKCFLVVDTANAVMDLSEFDPPDLHFQ